MKLLKLILILIFSGSRNEQLNCVVAEEVLSKLSLEEKLGQLFIIGVDNRYYIEENFFTDFEKQSNCENLRKLIKEYKIGGLHFHHNGKLENCFNAIKNLQKLSSIPLLISQDFEFGLNMRLDDAIKFPLNMTLGAIQNNALIYELGLEIGIQCKSLGVHINFAPVVDINSNPTNPVIGQRSFGEDPKNVAIKAIYFAKGLQTSGIIACAKHFCGHGDTNIDSHLDLPIINHSIERLNSIELYPFKEIINFGIKAIMSAHIHVPAIDSNANIPITLSFNAMTEILQKKLGFSGLIITDALDMIGITKYFKSGNVELAAFLSGNDIFLMSQDIPKAISKLKNGISKGVINEKDLDKRVLKILNAKIDLKLFNKKNNEQFSNENFHSKYAYDLKKKLFESSITLIKNQQKIIPLKQHRKIALILIGEEFEKCKVFYDQLFKFDKELNKFFINKNKSTEDFNGLYNLINQYEIIIVGIFNLNKFFNLNYGITENSINFLNKINLNKKVIVTIFGNPYSLKVFDNLKNVIMAYEEDIDAQKAAANVIFGKLLAKGKLPISLI